MNAVRELRQIGATVEVNSAPTPAPKPDISPEVQKAMAESLKHLDKNSKEYWTIKNAITGIHYS